MSNAVSTPDSEERPWHRRIPWLPLIALIVTTVALAVPVAVSWAEVMVHRSFQENLIQVLTVALLMMAFIRSDLRLPARYNPSWAGFFMLALTGLLLLAGAMLSIKALLWGSYLTLLACLCWALYGFRFVYSWLPVFMFSFFLLPELPADLRNTISLPLQMLSTKFTALLAGLLIPITIRGNIFYIEGNAFEVTVACSGLHTWIGFLFAGLMWMLFEKFSLKALLAILIGAPVLALVTNAIRLFITALVAYWGSPDLGVEIHTNLEYVLFPLGLVGMWLIGRNIYASEDRLEGKTNPENLEGAE